MQAVFSRPIPSLLGGILLVAAYAMAPHLFPGAMFRIVMGDLVPLLLLGLTCVLCCRNAVDSHGHTRLFWSLMATGMAMWWINQLGWTWYEVVLRKSIPDPFPGDVVLFLHIVPFMGAVAIRPHEADEKESVLISALNVFILLVWWVVVYAFFVFPEEYIATNIPVYTLRWDLLYVVEGLALIAVAAFAYSSSAGPWRKLYGRIVAGSIIYALASEALNAAIARGVYRTGGVYDLPFLTGVLAFLWVAWSGRLSLRETLIMPPIPKGGRAFAPLFAQVALISLPIMGYVALFLSHDAPSLRSVRFSVSMGGVAILAFFVFLKQYLLDRRLMRLLDHSRASFDSLQRLQGRAVQQAKLASLGELVALAASELEDPLSAILEKSERMAGNANLTREQLTNAQKIGQQARRTHALIADLLSFSQQTPGEKVPLELKPLLERALQMEAFKRENRGITLAVAKMNSVPRVLGNPNQLLQAFIQIVENAVDALQGREGGQFQVSAWHDSGEVVIQFDDNGPGLEHPERVFDPFYTTKPVGKGTGLGLSAAYGVIQDHRGQITCSNRTEGGARFEIRLPAFRVGSAVPAAAGIGSA
ncbi:MAG: HAMP domain-containing sensor histidine kinase [Terriglobales bacterium]|jgi:signal transduction histidine kinase